jgi:hypothetical protein
MPQKSSPRSIRLDTVRGRFSSVCSRLPFVFQDELYEDKNAPAKRHPSALELPAVVVTAAPCPTCNVTIVRKQVGVVLFRKFLACQRRLQPSAWAAKHGR